MVSAQSLVERRIAELGRWLAEQSVDVREERSHLDQGSRDRLYWHYGYFIGLQEALKVLTARGATLH
jgi:hypothetical protein